MPSGVAATVEKLRQARERLDPFATYRGRMPDGTLVEMTGAEMIADAEAYVAVADAIRRGEDPQVVKAAFERLQRTLGDEDYP
jgi:hypothetical protein